MVNERGAYMSGVRKGSVGLGGGERGQAGGRVVTRFFCFHSVCCFRNGEACGYDFFFFSLLMPRVSLTLSLTLGVKEWGVKEGDSPVSSRAPPSVTFLNTARKSCLMPACAYARGEITAALKYVHMSTTSMYVSTYVRTYVRTEYDRACRMAAVGTTVL